MGGIASQCSFLPRHHPLVTRKKAPRVGLTGIWSTLLPLSDRLMGKESAAYVDRVDGQYTHLPPCEPSEW
jgi:hypothetical protein